MPYTKTAYQIFDPLDGGGNPRGANISEVRTWGTEIEAAINEVSGILDTVDPSPADFALFRKSSTLLGLNENGIDLIESVPITGIADPSTGFGRGASGRKIPILNENWINLANYIWLRSADDTIYPCLIAVGGTWVAGEIAKVRVPTNTSGGYVDVSYTVQSGDGAQQIAAGLSAAMQINATLISTAVDIWAQASGLISTGIYGFHLVPKYRQYPFIPTNQSTTASGTVTFHRTNYGTGADGNGSYAENLLADPTGYYMQRAVVDRMPQANDYNNGHYWFMQVLANGGGQTGARLDLFSETISPPLASLQLRLVDPGTNDIRLQSIWRKGMVLYGASNAAPGGGENGDLGYGWFNAYSGISANNKASLSYTSSAGGISNLTLKDGGTVVGEVQAQSDGLIIGTVSSHPLIFVYGSSSLLTMTSAGLYPSTDNTMNLGTSVNHWITAYLQSITTNGILIGGANKSVSSTAAMTDGQLPFGVTGGSPTPRTVSGHLTFSNTGVATLANSGVTAGTNGASNRIPSLSVDQYGRVTAISQAYTPNATPQGRLTLSSGTPVMTSAVTDAATVYYTSYIGQYVPIYDGTDFIMTPIGSELSQATTDATKSPAACTTNSNYDLFVWNDGGTIRCTRGPAWSSDTARGTGAGTSELQRISGIWTNKVAITNGPVANRGTYVGTIRTNGSSQVDWKLGSSASGGGAASFGVWNAYNRRAITANLSDSAGNWTQTTHGTWQSLGGSTGNRVSAVFGLLEDGLIACLTCLVSAAAGGTAYVGIGIDITNNNTGNRGSSPLTTAGTILATYSGCPGLGWHFAQAVALSATADGTFYLNGADQGYTAQLMI